MGRIVGAYISPHPPIMIREIGGRESEKVSSTVQALEKISKSMAEKNADTIVIITPHGPMFRDTMTFSMEERLAGSFKNFGVPNLQYVFENDTELAESIMEEADREGVYCLPFTSEMAASYNLEKGLDHGALVPLHFINKENTNLKLVHITYSGLSREAHYRLGLAIKTAIDLSDRDCIVLASGDLSHRLIHGAPAGYDARGQEYDDYYAEIIKGGDVNALLDMDENLISAAGECAYRATIVLMGALDKCNIKGNILSYEGPFGVGYLVAELSWEGCDDISPLDEYLGNKDKVIKEIRENEDPYVRLARISLENVIKHNKNTIPPQDLPIEMIEKRAGVFVTLKKHGELRGCIGTINPTRKSIADEIIQNAVSAGLKDPRFLPLEEDELSDLVYSVDVLGEAERIESLSELDIKRYGVIVKKGMRKGLLLPNLDGIDSVEEQVSIALKKAGISEDESYQMERFEVVRHK